MRRVLLLAQDYLNDIFSILSDDFGINWENNRYDNMVINQTTNKTKFEAEIEKLEGGSSDEEYSIEGSQPKNVFLYSNCDAYAGELQMSKRNGWGVYLKYTGQKFEGLWKDNVRDGFGMQTIGNNIKFIGQFKNNEYNGRGIIFHQSGLMYSSKWLNGELVEKRPLFENWEDELADLFLDSYEEDIDSGKYLVAPTKDTVNDKNILTGRIVQRELGKLHINNSCKDLNSGRSESDAKVGAKHQLIDNIVFNEYDYLTKNSKIDKKIMKTLSNDIEGKALNFYNRENSAEFCLSWNIFQVAYFIKCIGLLKYVKNFILNEIEGCILPYIGANELKEIGIIEPSNIRYIRISLALLLKLRLRCIRKHAFTPQKLIDDEYLKSFEIPASDLSLKCRIGEGGYGKVYKAVWTSRGITVAVKAFRRRDKNALVREFYSELTIISRIRHPNITLFLGVVMSPLYCLVTELVPNGSLFDLLHTKNSLLTSNQLLKVSRDICCGMAYLHENGVLHCDLKSSNILLSGNFNVKIGDFGLSTLMESPLETRKMLGCVGTHHWMAPEILRGEGFTKSADVYSFGIILWEMLTKKIPHEDLNINHIVASVGYGHQKLTMPGNIPTTLEVIIKKTWSRNVNSRPSFKQLTDIFEYLYQSSILDIEENLLAFFGY
ncbi:Ser/Thr protein kinase [Cryptosporidium canis]|uniref:Ser/Thr protein kinase n=1 Tax=Cryptosporidium canis TaxID=195482 RepID=A0ABQ8P7G6_9CRYT|nr:Ser/Thr protein kinase [Cryptosporidium canis]KAJ1615095.1 Ser/Thr protein kinase [Cryptosporidium canis]